MKKNIGLLVVALLVFVVSVYLALQWITSRSDLPSVSRDSELSTRIQEDNVTSPAGWKKIDVAGNLTLFVPPDMEASEVLGDYSGYLKAFKNADIRVSISYDEADPCTTPAHLLERPTYRESTIVVDGRNAKLGIDTFYQPESSTAYLCILGINGSKERLRVSAIYGANTALDTVKQIFSTIKFNDRK